MKLLKRLRAIAFTTAFLASANIAQAGVKTLSYDGYEIKVNTSNKVVKIKYNGSIKCSYKIGSFSVLNDAYSCAERTGGKKMAQKMFEFAKSKLF